MGFSLMYLTVYLYVVSEDLKKLQIMLRCSSNFSGKLYNTMNKIIIC